MTALAGFRDTLKQGPQALTDTDSYPVAASTKCWQGGMAALSAGYVQPATSAAGLVIVGRFEKNVDNSAGSAGTLVVDVRRGTFRWGNSASTDLIAQANVGQTCYAVDDATVALTDAGGTRSVAGVIKAVDTVGVWVETANMRVADAQPKLIITLPIDLASIGTGQVIGAITPGFAGRVLKDFFVTNKPVTTGSKAATLQPRITGVAITGGAVALTSALATPQGAVIAGSAITALNKFGAADTIDVQASSVTAFVEGSGSLVLVLG